MRDEVVRDFEQKLQQLKESNNSGDIGAAINKLNAEAESSYELRTANYDKHVSIRVHEELKIALNQRIDLALDELAKHRKDQLIVQFDQQTQRDRFAPQPSLTNQLEEKFRFTIE